MWWILIILSTALRTDVIFIPELFKKPDCSQNSTLREDGVLIKDFLEVFPSDGSQPEVSTEVFVGKYSD